MLLYTIQPKEVYEYACKHEFFSDFSKSEFNEVDINLNLDVHDSFYYAYYYISKVLNKKCPKPKNAQFPIWAWYKYNDKVGKIDLRSFTKETEKGTYLLELEVPDNEVLLSDFTTWHGVLNRWIMHDPYDENKYEDNEEFYDSLTGLDRFRAMVKSWDIIFNFKPNIYSYCDDIQACFWSIKPEYIRKFWIFGSKKC